jgi:hypothetical protein
MNNPQEDNQPFARQLAFLLKQSLQLGVGDDLLVIYDESFFDFLPYLVSAARTVGTCPALLYFPKALQLDLVVGTPIENLPNGLIAAVSDSTTILNVLSGDIKTAALRRAILSLSRPEFCRFAHVPGLSVEILSILEKSKLSQCIELCDITAWALGEAQQVSLHTQDKTGKDLFLKMELEGWDNDPLMSPGIIYRGSWGNVPPAEVFCCPDPRTVSGTVCINGSIPGLPLREKEEVIITFESGKLVDWTSENAVAMAFIAARQNEAEQAGDRNWNTFAELGIGLNTEVSFLTGNSLFDEKAYGTVHIALGDNSGFGHGIRSQIHVDLVCKNPTLSAENIPIILNGKVAVDQLTLARSGRARAFNSVITESRIVFLTEKAAVIEGRLLRRLHSAGRLGYVAIADEHISSDLAVFWDTAVALGISDTSALREVPFNIAFEAGRAINLLAHYRMVVFEEK